MLRSTTTRYTRRHFHVPPCICRSHHPVYARPRRSITSLANEFLDLAIALPLPPSWPPYSTTIIICTVLSRLLLTVPISIWAKRRQWRAEEIVFPAIEGMKDGVAKMVFEDMKKDRIRGSKDELKVIHQKRVRDVLKTRRDELFVQHGCRPLPTMLLPPLTQLPLFTSFSLVLTHLSQAPTPLDTESFLTLSTLTHPDPTAVLPIALGFLTLANVESARWGMSDAQRTREAQVERWTEERRGRGETVLRPQKVVQSVLRVVAVARILVGSVVPGGVILYWVTSAAFGLVQTWIFDYWELRRRRRWLITQT